MLELTWRQLVCIASLCVASLVITACASATNTRPATNNVVTHRAAAVAVASPNTGGGPLIRRLSIAQLAGQRVVYAYSGLTPPRALLGKIHAGEAGGVILFGPNISSRTQVKRAVGKLQWAAAASPVHLPVLVMIDQEGGLVRRLPGAPELSERQIGKLANPELVAREAGRGAGRNLASAGINVNLAPVLDVYGERGNFIDEFQRSYGSDATQVAGLASAFVSEQQDAGVAATAKHFPGLGEAARSQNTDVVPVALDQSLAQLRAVDELPFAAAIAAGVRLVMVSWATYGALDSAVPAGLSAAVIQGELRKRLGFRGVTITDGLAAGALERFGSVADRGVEAARAGADLLLCSATSPSANTPSEGISVLRGLVSAFNTHELTRTEMEQAAARILALRAQMRTTP